VYKNTKKLGKWENLGYTGEVVSWRQVDEEQADDIVINIYKEK
jgi:hypothetical protein